MTHIFCNNIFKDQNITIKLQGSWRPPSCLPPPSPVKDVVFKTIYQWDLAGRLSGHQEQIRLIGGAGRILEWQLCPGGGSVKKNGIHAQTYLYMLYPRERQMEKNKADWWVQPWILWPLGSSSSKPAYLVFFIITQLRIQLFHIFCWTQAWSFLFDCPSQLICTWIFICWVSGGYSVQREREHIHIHKNI